MNLFILLLLLLNICIALPFEKSIQVRPLTIKGVKCILESFVTKRQDNINMITYIDPITQKIKTTGSVFMHENQDNEGRIHDREFFEETKEYFGAEKEKKIVRLRQRIEQAFKHGLVYKKSKPELSEFIGKFGYKVEERIDTQMEGKIPDGLTYEKTVSAMHLDSQIPLVLQVENQENGSQSRKISKFIWKVEGKNPEDKTPKVIGMIENIGRPVRLEFGEEATLISMVEKQMEEAVSVVAEDSDDEEDGIFEVAIE